MGSGRHDGPPGIRHFSGIVSKSSIAAARRVRNRLGTAHVHPWLGDTLGLKVKDIVQVQGLVSSYTSPRG